MNTKGRGKLFNILNPTAADAAELQGMQTADLNQARVLFLNNISYCNCQRENVELVLLVWSKKVFFYALMFLLCSKTKDAEVAQLLLQYSVQCKTTKQVIVFVVPFFDYQGTICHLANFPLSCAKT